MDRSTSRGTQHIRIHPQCGVCGAAFKSHEKIAALQGSYDSTRVEWGSAATFPPGYYCEQGDVHKIFCRSIQCQYCGEVPESATVHLDCFNLFVKRCQADNKLERLMVAATWRYPWYESPPLILTPADRGACWELVDQTAKTHNLPQLRTLPPELHRMIWDYLQPDSLVTLPLDIIRSWTRGSDPVTEGAMDYTIRLTMDSKGLQQIDRSSEPTSNRKSRPGEVVYVVESAEHLTGVNVEFKVGIHPCSPSLV
ncbi:hypothetical protein G7Z17_g2177 [Cylindrodendrum hubeiense]|uniref:Uncharacterized protein n=1 Tax=Cylindrodendrum hubeiense TaxID=595255 RepID=A0A9P5HDF1_9HYPO|nr:hypothetical protein G7Z17_g2177 [Cylindrodendrum hubeiense]